MSFSAGKPFIQAFGEARLRRMYPSADVELHRHAYDSRVSLRVTFDERDLVQYDRDAALRMVSRSLEPQKPRRHWSHFRRRRP